MRKIALFAFQGDPMCFVHVLLNALDLRAKGHELRIIVEGSATQLIAQMARDESPLFPLYRRAKEQGLFEGACKACSAKLNVVEAVELEGFPLLGDMSGHPSMSQYLEKGYDIITF